jgi:hypothetical protein
MRPSNNGLTSPKVIAARLQASWEKQRLKMKCPFPQFPQFPPSFGAKHAKATEVVS